jgi:aspartoacylase
MHPAAIHSSPIKSVLICGGTHGNELSGVYAVTQWQNDDTDLKKLAGSANIDFLMVNQASVDANVRFIDEDFNRQFSLVKLAENSKKNDEELNHEAALAHRLNLMYGPKQSPQLDFIIDIHNTTSAMGPTLIVLARDHFNIGLARYVKTHMPSANILVEDHLPYADLPYFCTLAKQSVMVEVGAQAQGTLRAEVYQQTVEMTEHILAFVHKYNNDLATSTDYTSAYPKPVEAFSFTKDTPYPLNETGQRTAMIHPKVDAQDFKPLEKGQACFVDFKGRDILWEGETTYPHFIGEAAYNKLNIAFAGAHKTQI